MVWSIRVILEHYQEVTQFLPDSCAALRPLIPLHAGVAPQTEKGGGTQPI